MRRDDAMAAAWRATLDLGSVVGWLTRANCRSRLAERRRRAARSTEQSQEAA